jgi:hypothetical protein
MRHTPSLDLVADILEGLEVESLLYYDRVEFPKGEFADHVMDEAVEYITNDIPLPVDLTARLDALGIIVDEFEAWVRKTLEVSSDTRH